MRINSIIKESKVNGPGNRAVIWVQGCNKNCEGCFNQSALAYDAGIEMSPEQIIDEIEIDKIDGVTISGGEPFDQSMELKKLLSILKAKCINILIYTGYEYEYLVSRFLYILKLCNYIIDGPYRKDRPSLCKWAGSGNQRFLQLESGYILNDLTESEEYSKNAEIMIDKTGNITITGFIEE